jgi:hypothetical protein
MRELEGGDVSLAFFLTHFVEYFYLPKGAPWYTGNVYGNVFVVPIVAVLGWFWSRSRFWPVRPVTKGVERLRTKLDAHSKRQDEHNEWVADHIAAIHRKQGLGEPEPHPHFDLPAGEPIRPATELPVEGGKDATS